MKNEQLKRRYIEAAFEIIQEEGRVGVTIRRLAKILDCNIASLYRCFYDLDDLFLYTGLKYVEGYLKALGDILEEDIDNKELYFRIWECFIGHAFKNPKMYNSIFFGKYSSKLEFATEEYFTRLFPEEFEQFDEETRQILMRGTLQKGDSMISRTLEKCVSDGFITEENRVFIDKLFLQIFKGYLKDFVDGRKDALSIDESKQELMNYYKDIFSKYQ